MYINYSNKMELLLGKWDNESGIVLVTDPCYDKPQSNEGGYFAASAIIYNAVKGQWNSMIIQADLEIWGPHNAKLITWHTALGDGSSLDKIALAETEFAPCVDSGQLGIFDYSEYPDGDTGEYGDIDSFYGKCCDYTINTREAAHIMIFNRKYIGVVSRSGCGDGMYPCYIHKNEQGQVDIIAVDFLPDYDDAEDYNMEDNDVEGNDAEDDDMEDNDIEDE
jgi:hypothetical protein